MRPRQGLWGKIRKDRIMEVIKVKRYKAGYEIRSEQLTEEEAGGTPGGLVMKSAYTIPEGYYIGDSKTAFRLIVKRGIKPQPREPARPDANNGKGRTCSIGFSEQAQKWYGWSHRAIFGFGIGDAVKEGDCTASSGWTDEYLKEHPEEDLSLPVGFVAQTLEDCKLMAIAFAESVS